MIRGELVTKSTFEKQPKLKTSSIPEHVFLAHFAELDSAVQLDVAVADRAGVKAYGFAFDGAPVPMSQGKGKFSAQSGQKKFLEWVMIGDPGGTMKVTVSRDGQAVKEREKSTIPDSGSKGYDAFEIEMS
jgi:hypothetical protein